MKTQDLGQGIWLIAPVGYLTGGKETEAFEAEIKRLAELSVKHLILDCARVDVFNATALGVLISANSNFLRRDGALAFARVQERVEKVFEFIGLNRFFDIYPDVETAKSALLKRMSTQ